MKKYELIGKVEKYDKSKSEIKISQVLYCPSLKKGNSIKIGNLEEKIISLHMSYHSTDDYNGFVGILESIKTNLPRNCKIRKGTNIYKINF